MYLLQVKVCSECSRTGGLSSFFVERDKRAVVLEVVASEYGSFVTKPES